MLKQKMMELMKKKLQEKGELSDMERQAKMKAMKEMMGLAQDEMSEGLKKVTIASNSKEGLKEGLEKAEDILEKGPDMMEMAQDQESEDDMEEPEESEMEMDDSEDEMAMEESPEEEIRKLEEKLAALKAKKQGGY